MSEMPERVWLGKWVALPLSDGVDPSGTMFVSLRSRDDSEQYIRADLHAAEIAKKDEEIATLQSTCAEYELRLGAAKVGRVNALSAQLAKKDAVIAGLVEAGEKVARTLDGLSLDTAKSYDIGPNRTWRERVDEALAAWTAAKKAAQPEAGGGKEPR
jgi:hypothetical protein